MKIVVDTLLDTNAANAQGGEMSLREAIALAEATAGADEIVFSETLLDASGTAYISLATDAASPSLLGSSQTSFTGFTVNSADGLTINGDIDGDGVADVELNGGFFTEDDRYFMTAHFMIGTEGVLTLEALNLIDGGMVFFDAAASAGNGTYSNVSPAGSDGEDAFGSILNEGSLTLDRVRIDGAVAIAQDAGDGGLGYTNPGALPDGTDGVDGRLGVAATAGHDGRDGVDGAAGGTGGDGGNAAGAILNRGDLTLINSALGDEFTAEAGDGGTGGKGGRGGNGSDGGIGGDAYVGTTAKAGGEGGDTGTPGAAGDGGDGGDAALGILNLGGTVNHETGLAVDGFAGAAGAGAAGATGTVGDRGVAGSGGLGGSKLISGRADSGANGLAWYGRDLGNPGSAGTAHDAIGGADTPTTDAVLVWGMTDQDRVDEGEKIVFQIGLTSAGTGDVVTVDYRVLVDRIAGETADFEAGTLLSGSVEISSGEGAVLALPTLLDGRIEDDERVTLQITGARTTYGGVEATVSLGLASVDLASNAETEIDLDNIFKVDDGQETDGGMGNDTIEGSELADVFHGSAGRDDLIGLGGSDTLNGGSGDDRVRGGAGDDWITGRGGADTLLGNDGADTILGGGGADSLSGGNGDDTLKGNGARDELLGKKGRDSLEGGSGSDKLDGGSGRDRLDGGKGRDTLSGGDGADRLRGGDGSDALQGGGGADKLSGDGGHDRITGGRGNDTIFGGDGRDAFIFAKGDGDDVIRDFEQGIDRIEIGRGAGDFGEVNIVQRGADVKISFADVTILVKHEDAGDFAAGDFIF